MRFIIAIAGVLFFSGCQHAVVRKTTALMNYEDAQKQKLMKSKISPKEHSEGFKAEYNRLFNGQKLEFEKYDDKVLKELWLASYLMAAYSLEQKYILQMEDIFENLKQRKIEKKECFNDSCVENLFTIYLKFSDFPKAKHFAQQYPDILTDYVPDINEDVAMLKKPYRLYKISPDGRSLSLISIQMDDTKNIVALMNPECYFAEQAMNAISSTSDLREYFEKHALIIYPLNSSISGIAKTAEWNTNNPKLEYFVYLDKNDMREDWKQFDLKALTDFYFLKNNQIVDRIPGWTPKEGQFIADIRNAINKLK